MNIPEYQNYQNIELIKCMEAIDRRKYPERYLALSEEVNRRKASGEFDDSFGLERRGINYVKVAGVLGLCGIAVLALFWMNSLRFSNRAGEFIREVHSGNLAEAKEMLLYPSEQKELMELWAKFVKGKEVLDTDRMGWKCSISPLGYDRCELTLRVETEERDYYFTASMSESEDGIVIETFDVFGGN